MTQSLSSIIKEHALQGGIVYAGIALASAIFSDNSIFDELHANTPIVAGLSVALFAEPAKYAAQTIMGHYRQHEMYRGERR